MPIQDNLINPAQAPRIVSRITPLGSEIFKYCYSLDLDITFSRIITTTFGFDPIDPLSPIELLDSEIPPVPAAIPGTVVSDSLINLVSLEGSGRFCAFTLITSPIIRNIVIGSAWLIVRVTRKQTFPPVPSTDIIVPQLYAPGPWTQTFDLTNATNYPALTVGDEYVFAYSTFSVGAFPYRNRDERIHMVVDVG